MDYTKKKLCSSLGRHLGWFLFLATENMAALNMDGVQVCGRTQSLGTFPEAA